MTCRLNRLTRAHADRPDCPASRQGFRDRARSRPLERREWPYCSLTSPMRRLTTRLMRRPTSLCHSSRSVLLDFYPYPGSETSGLAFLLKLGSEGWDEWRFGFMGLDVLLPPGNYAGGREMLAWSRWQLGWLDEVKVGELHR